MVGVATLLAITRHGAYLSPDALAYVGTARNLIDGHGYTAPPGSPEVGNFPPLFTLLLAGAGALGPDPLTVAQVANPLLFGATILAIGLAIRRMTGSLGLALGAQLLVLSGVDFLAYHTAALSEPLFLFLGVVALAAVAACLPRRRLVLLAVAALAAGAATVTRYLGLAVIAAGVIAVVLAAKRRPRWWLEPIAFAAIAAAPVLAWTAYLRATEGRVTNRTAVAHPPDQDYVTGGLRTASRWLLPDEVSWPLRGVLAAAVVILVVVAAARSHPRAGRSGHPGRRADGSAARRAVTITAAFALLYVAALVGDRWLFDVTGRLDARFLLPLHVAAIVLGAWALRAVDFSRDHVTRLILSAVVGIQVMTGALWASDALTDRAVRPGGFTAPGWKQAQVLDEVRAMSPTAAVYTNQADALYFHTGRVARPIPEKQAFLTGEPNMNYGAQLVAMADDLRRGGLLVYFTAAPARRAFLPTPDELVETLRLQVVSRDQIGVSFRLPPT